MMDCEFDKDFLQVVDGLETVTLRRRDTAEKLAVEAASRSAVDKQEAQSSDGAVVQSDAVWHVQLPSEVSAVELGDVLVDDQDCHWTVLRVSRRSRLGCFRCETRELRIAFGCTNRIDVDRPVWGDVGNGPEIVSWTQVCLSLPVHLQMDEMLLDTSTTPPTKQLFYRVTLGEAVAVEPGDRLIAEDGTFYRVQSLEQAARIDVLPVAVALQELEA